ncbi:MAG: RNase P subunit p30 family protein [Sulfolobales archaeon]|nr:hypothetical protein [Sulfolobales archaeon]MDW7968839.1 RNase P subunit p30 family protein [Sulfolobales archaeon]
MYVDMHIKPYNYGELDRILRTAKRMGYVAGAVEGLNGKVISDLTVLPRVTYRYSGKPLSPNESRKGCIIVYEICDPAMIKSLTNLRGRCHAIKIAGSVLSRLKRKYVGALRSCGTPVEISLKDIVVNNGVNYNTLRGLYKLLPYVERGDIELLISSSAGDEFELVHPLEVISMLRELGLSELTSTKAISSLPSRIMRVLGNGV